MLTFFIIRFFIIILIYSLYYYYISDYNINRIVLNIKIYYNEINKILKALY